MPSSSIQIPSNLGAGIGDQASGLISQLSASGLITLIVGVLLAAVVIDIIIGSLRQH